MNANASLGRMLTLYCDCGCGRELTGKAQRWATPACAVRYRKDRDAVSSRIEEHKRNLLLFGKDIPVSDRLALLVEAARKVMG